MLNKIFNSDNPFWQSMNTVFDLFVVNTLWLICCIPIVTIGPATVALFYALILRAQGLDGYISRDFFRSLKQNLKQGIILGLIVTLTGAFLAFDMYLCYKSGRGIFTFFLFFFGVLFVFWAFTSLYAFPILARFERKTSEILVWAFTLSIKNLPMTVMMLFVTIAGLWLCHILPALIFIIFALIVQFCAPVMASIFKPFIPVEEDEFDQYDEPKHTETKDYMDYDNIQDLF
ncbi:MAG: YesL family protein [Lachnospiraceae bacterium]|nr:YesL family protein [Lachnospiraceae bacterium]